MSLEQMATTACIVLERGVETTAFDPAKVLGCSREEAQRLMRGHVVTPGEVEGVALRTYRWRAHLRDPNSYWVTVSQAATILGRSRPELQRALSRRRLPYCTHVSGVRLMRRRQIEEMAAHIVPFTRAARA